MAKFLSPVFNDAQLDSSGNPFSGALLFTYAAGGSTKTATYQDEDGNTAHSNPIVLNSRGEPPAPIWLNEGQDYKFRLCLSTESDPPSSSIRDIDDVVGVNDASLTLSQWVASGAAPTYVSATSFTVSGDKTSDFAPNRRVRTVNTGGTFVATIVYSDYNSGTGLTTVVIDPDTTGLDAGLSSFEVGIFGGIRSGSTYQPDTDGLGIAGGRLTLTTGGPVTGATDATTLYYTPHISDFIDIYTTTDGGSWWVRRRFSELSIDIPAVALPHDVWIYDNAGTLTLELTAWTNDSTRATALTTQNNIYVKTGETHKRYLGTIYARSSGGGICSDDAARRHVWNYYNRIPRLMRVIEATNTWTYSTAAWQQANANAANQIDFVTGVNEGVVFAMAHAYAISSGATARTVRVGIGNGSTTAISTNGACLPSQAQVTSSIGCQLTAIHDNPVGIGKVTLTWLEWGGGADTQTWHGDNGSATDTQNGIFGIVWG